MVQNSFATMPKPTQENNKTWFHQQWNNGANLWELAFKH
jgi:hypothetical protein